MIVELTGQLIEKKEQAVVIRLNGISYEVWTPSSVLERIDATQDKDGQVHLVIYYYLQIGPAGGIPILVGFINEVERDFFLQFIKVSGIGPKGAVKAFDRPISEIAQAINEGKVEFLKTLPGIGAQRAKEIVAKLQGKVGRFTLIQDQASTTKEIKKLVSDWQQEALMVLLQLQYKRPEAEHMIQKALERSKDIQTTEALLNEIYKQKAKL
jgi:holliday junction DNA helicase RuvA